MPTREPNKPRPARLNVFHCLVADGTDQREALGCKRHDQGESFWRELRVLAYRVSFLGGVLRLNSGKGILPPEGPGAPLLVGLDQGGQALMAHRSALQQSRQRSFPGPGGARRLEKISARC